jgi:pimeloyl-ACP methyl ester carboxylesterase
VATQWSAALVGRMLARLDADLIAERAPTGWARLDAAHRGNARGVLASLHPFVRSLEHHAIDARPPQPALVMTGSRDELFGLAPALDLSSALENADLAVVPGIGHRLGADEAALLAPLLARFLDG